MNKTIRIAAIALSLTGLIFSFLLLVGRIKEKAVSQLPKATETSVNLYIDPATPWNNGVVVTSKPKVELLSTEHITEESTTDVTAATTKHTVYEQKTIAKPAVEKIVPTTEPYTEEHTTVEEPTEEVTDAAETTEKQNEETEKNSESNRSFIGKMYVTAYTAEEGFPEGSATASGYGVRSGYCALNNSQRQALGIRYGDRIYVEGLGTYTVMDCGCNWGVVDIWVYSNAEAYSLTGYYNVYYA